MLICDIDTPTPPQYVREFVRYETADANFSPTLLTQPVP